MRRDMKEAQPAVRALAGRVMRRLAAAGDRSLSREDIESELWIAWCLACDTYNAESGVPFLAYLRSGMMMHINRYVEKHVTRRHDEVIALSMDRKATNDDGGDIASGLGDTIPDGQPSPDEAIMEESAFAHALKQLSPRARTFITILRDQPEALLKQVQQLQVKADYAKKTTGFTLAISNRLTSDMVFTLMAADRNERTKITAEIRSLGDRLATRN